MKKKHKQLFMFSPGDQALVVGKHPHTGAQIELLEYGPYGLDFLNLVGWKARRLDTSEEFYCQLENLAAHPSQAAAVRVAEVEEVPAAAEQLPAEAAAHLLPTVSPARRESTLDRLRAFYKAPESVLLSSHQQKVLDRLEAAWSLILDKKTSEDAAKKLMRKFEISKAQAYRDLSDCKQLFGDAVKSSKEADRYLLKEMGLETYHKARKAGELDQMNKALANLVKITGIEKDDPTIPDAEAFLPSSYVLELKSRQGKDLTLNLETIAALPAHEYEEVLDIIQESGGVSELEMLQKIMEAARGTVE